MSQVRILVVDDDPASCQLLSDVLEQEGYRVDQATTGKQALDLLRKNSYQIAFLDIRLPDLSGLDLLEKIKQSGKQTESIMHTAYASLKTSIVALNKGALTYIIKPFHPQEIRLAVKRALDKQRLEMENISLIENLKKRNSELEQAYRNLEDLTYRLVVSEKTAALTTLGGGIAHELNNPLTSILGMTRLLQDEEEPGSKIFNRLGRIQAEVKRCAEIVKDLLTFTRQVGGKWEPVDCNQVISRTVHLLDYQFKKAQVTVETRLEKDLPSVKAVPGQLGQAFLNLLLNSLEAVAGKEDGKIEVRMSRLADTIVIEFRDNGRGIPREDIPRIFEPFFTSKEPGKGPGLGLSASEGVIKSFGGTISVESKVGSGSTFQITLPVTSA